MKDLERKLELEKYRWQLCLQIIPVLTQDPNVGRKNIAAMTISYADNLIKALLNSCPHVFDTEAFCLICGMSKGAPPLDEAQGSP